MAEKGSLQLEIVTPKGVMLSERVDEVVAPSVRGEFGVLPGHLPLLAAMRTGLVHYSEGGARTDVGVGRGFVEVLNDRAVLLTDRFITEDQVDTLAVRERLKEVDAEIDAFRGDLSDPKRLELIDEEQWLATQLELIGDPPVPMVLEESRAQDYREVIPKAPEDGDDAEAAEGEHPDDE